MDLCCFPEKLPQSLLKVHEKKPLSNTQFETSIFFYLALPNEINKKALSILRCESIRVSQCGWPLIFISRQLFLSVTSCF